MDGISILSGFLITSHPTCFSLLACCFYNTQGSLLWTFFDAVTDDYGQDSDGPISPSHDASNVEIPEVNLVLNSDNYSTLQRAVYPLQPSEDFEMDLYEEVIQLLATFGF